MATSIRVMSTNLLGGRADPGAYRALLDRFEPDLVVTQELGHAQAEVLADRFRLHHLLPTDEFHGRGMATRLEAEFGDVPMAGRAGTAASIAVNGGEWHLLGIHLLNPLSFPQWQIIRDRGRQLRAISDWGSRVSGPTAVVGDFNASPRWPAYRRMGRGWRDLVADRAGLAGVRPERTWSWRPGWPRLLRIDHVFGRQLKALEVAVAPIMGSDHHALVVDLSESH